MRNFVLVLFCVFLFGAMIWLKSQDAMALMPAPPSQLVDLSVSPDCILVEAGSGSGSGTYSYRRVEKPIASGTPVLLDTSSKGPVIELTNNCQFDIVLSLDTLYPIEDPETTYDVEDVVSRISSEKYALPDSSGYRRRLTETLWIFSFDEGREDCSEEITRKALVTVKGQTISQGPPEKKECKAVRIPHDKFNRLVVPVARDDCFRFSGYAPSQSDDLVVELAGCVVGKRDR